MGLTLERLSLGVGDRFAHQAKAQLRAFQIAAMEGVSITPVWNKSHREHTTVGSKPVGVREAADQAVLVLGWDKPFHVDADHIRLKTVEEFLAPSDFFTIDVADEIGQQADPADLSAFLLRHPELVGRISIAGIDGTIEMSRAEIERIAGTYLRAIQEAGRIYRHIEARKGAGEFITEISIDETDAPQTPIELLVILAAIADEAIPIQTIAPKFTGRFNKGVDYVGNLAQFEKEFNDDIAVVCTAMERYGLPGSLKLSVHSGSDKFSIYPSIRRAVARFDTGVHVKTAGTTWLEELIGLAEAGTDGLVLVKDVYQAALDKREALCAPYAAVIDIDVSKLPTAAEFAALSSADVVATIRHDQANPAYNPSVRQLLHVGYKIAAQMGDRYFKLLDACEAIVAKNVTENLYRRHIRPLFVDDHGAK
jgi:hypothetical protein